MIQYKTKKVIDVEDWDNLVQETYGKPYSFQQQDECKPRGIVNISVPSTYTSDYKNDTLPERVNHPNMGVSFKAWLERDPKQPLSDKGNIETDQWSIDLWWERNFYPHVSMIINDLHQKGLLETGDYAIDIDW